MNIIMIIIKDIDFYIAVYVCVRWNQMKTEVLTFQSSPVSPSFKITLREVN